MVILILIIILIILHYVTHKEHFLMRVTPFNKQYIYVVSDKVYKYDIYKPIDIRGFRRPIIYVQGNVHGNEASGFYTCIDILKKYSKLAKGTLVVFPMPNKIGLEKNLRSKIMNDYLDINRNFIDDGKCFISKLVIGIIKHVDWIIDFHEGWGYNNIHSNSIGSTIGYSNQVSKNIAKYILFNLNTDLTGYKKFNLNNDYCIIKSTLGCYCNKKNINYLLIETTGQNDIQDLNIRVAQMNKIFDLFYNKIICNN